MQAMPVAPPTREALALDVAASIVRQIDGAIHASVALLTTGEPRILVSTDERIDTVGDPCDEPAAAVLRTGHIVRVPTVERNTDFPDYIAKCRRLGISSMAGFPIKDAALRTVGVLTITSADHHGFGTSDLIAGRRTAEQLARVLCKPSFTERPPAAEQIAQ